MAADRGRRLRRSRVWATLSALMLVGLTGCVGMPDESSAKRVDSSHRADADSQVRVFGVSPQKGEKPRAIVRGFLEATTSDEASFATAREYLTKERARLWDPFAGTTVLTEGPVTSELVSRVNGDNALSVSGSRIAKIDASHGYAPDKGSYREEFHLTKVKGEWRIDQLPDGVILGETDFQRIYRSVNTYFYARLGPDSDSVASGKDVLVADPVYLRRRINPVTETVRSLLDGPTQWLSPVADSAFPQGTRLAKGQRLSLDDDGHLTVRLTVTSRRVDSWQCRRMAAQLLHTVQDQASAKVNRVRLTNSSGEELCAQRREDAEIFEPNRLNGQAENQYFVDGQFRVAALPADRERAKPVTGPLGKGKVQMGSVAVNREETQGAAVARGGRALYVAALQNTRQSNLNDPVVTSTAKKEKDRLSAPSWDGLGDVWVADRNPSHPRLLRARAGVEQPEEVEVPDLSAGERIESLRVSSEGARIALRIRGNDDRVSLQLGRVERGGTRGDRTVRVTQLRPVAPHLEEVVATSWAGGSRLVVVGREQGGVEQLQYVQTDGSVTNLPTLPGLNDVTGVAATEDDSKPLLAESRDGIVRLPPDANWKTVAEQGSAPVYPG
ncbi:LpqB family beta-propeller domain-containing protein [Streptomyces sp. NPDC005438]|uniref:LpqB family beta-propeller domain-containing protein n=1 Tax=Streptomyces sp. NPDC005438 TaxID=3156880 RepID=UPI00339F9E39